MAFTLNPLKMKLPMQLVLMVLVIVFLGDYIPLEIKRFFYAISQTLQEILTFLLPFIVFSYLTSCILSFKKGALAFIAILLAVSFASTFITTVVSYGGCRLFLDYLNLAGPTTATGSEPILIPLWSLKLLTSPIDKYFNSKYALYAGLIVGLIFSFIRSTTVEKFTSQLKNACAFFLNKVFIPLVPIFILGFIIKLEFEGVLKQVLKSYAPLYILNALLQWTYILFLYGLFNNFNPIKWFSSVKNMVPASIIGFSCMSSAAAMPFTLLGCEQNTHKPNIVRAVIPATVNIHMIGNSFTIPVLGLAIAATFGLPTVDFASYLQFSFFFALSSFAVAAVPSGGILVMLPHLVDYLGFTPEMVSLILTIYLIFDTVITTSNILGNGAFAIFYSKLFSKLKIGLE